MLVPKDYSLETCLLKARAVKIQDLMSFTFPSIIKTEICKQRKVDRDTTVESLFLEARRQNLIDFQ